MVSIAENATKMSKYIDPFAIVSSTALVYGLICRGLLPNSTPTSTQAKLKSLSASHATLTTILGLCALKYSRLHDTENRPHAVPGCLPDGNLDDRKNPLIWDKSPLANAITALEAGYLIYDTAAMIFYPSSQPRSRRTGSLIIHAAKNSPDLFAHHVLLAAGLMTLQYYIRQDRERGVWVIVVFILMNASTPFMHARWWARKKGYSSRLTDLAFVVTFAACRFGTIGWVLRQYGRYHGLGPVEAFGKLRWYCQAGTGGLLVMNGLWWLLLLRGILKRRLQSKTKA